MTLETKQLGTGDVTGDLAAGEWKRRWRFSDWGVEMMIKSWWLGIEGAAGDLTQGIGDSAADTVEGDWRQNWRHSDPRVAMTLKTYLLLVGHNTRDLAARERRRHWRLCGKAMETTVDTP